MNVRLSTFIILFLWFGDLLAQAALNPVAPFTVVLDPGHGGSDQGAIYRQGASKVTEKDLTLLLAFAVEKELKKNNIDVALTRTADLDIPLVARTAIANRKKANVFLSIHMNSASELKLKNPSTGGIETYFLNNSTDATTKRLADLENAVLKESIAANTAPHSANNSANNSNVSLIVKDLLLDGNIRESKTLACMIQNELIKKTTIPATRSMKDRGVKQALFYVLLGADMPSALLEAGFMNNPQDRLLVLTREGRQLMARSIAQAIGTYRNLNQNQKTNQTISNCKVR